MPNISKSDILEALGIESPNAWVAPAFIGFGVGALVGAAVAFLVAPKAGAELREDLLDKSRKVVQRGREQIGNMNLNRPV